MTSSVHSSRKRTLYARHFENIFPIHGSLQLQSPDIRALVATEMSAGVGGAGRIAPANVRPVKRKTRRTVTTWLDSIPAGVEKLTNNVIKMELKTHHEQSGMKRRVPTKRVTRHA